MKKFAIWDKDGKQSIVEADSVEVKRDDKTKFFNLKFKTGSKSASRKGIMALIETMPPFILPGKL